MPVAGLATQQQYGPRYQQAEHKRPGHPAGKQKGPRLQAGYEKGEAEVAAEQKHGKSQYLIAKSGKKLLKVRL